MENTADDNIWNQNLTVKIYREALRTKTRQIHRVWKPWNDQLVRTSKTECQQLASNIMAWHWVPSEYPVTTQWPPIDHPLTIQRWNDIGKIMGGYGQRRGIFWERNLRNETSVVVQPVALQATASPGRGSEPTMLRIVVILFSQWYSTAALCRMCDTSAKAEQI